MSYTDFKQELTVPLDDTYKAINELRNVLIARLNDDSYTDEHLCECGESIKEITDFEVILKLRFKNTV